MPALRTANAVRHNRVTRVTPDITCDYSVNVPVPALISDAKQIRQTVKSASR
ncbi:MAG: hypothetical protein LBS43_07130 [Prevotellaceae bacterium]|nr:hypothetical protein [Prevotellaceae bacterium]